jgi:hypothetical protein
MGCAVALSLSLPSLGVSSLDLGRLWQRKRPLSAQDSCSGNCGERFALSLLPLGRRALVTGAKRGLGSTKIRIERFSKQSTQVELTQLSYARHPHAK